MKCPRLSLIQACVFIVILAAATLAQTTAFSYQGRLNDGSNAANGTYEMQFRLFDAASAGTQIGSTVTNSAVNVANGIFTVSLDFGSSPFAAGANRFLEVGVRKAADPPGFTLLTPRQQLTSSPYSLFTLSAATANGLSAACVTCVTDAQINSISGSKVTGTVSSATNAGNVTGTVAIANGGTGATSAVNARTNLGLGTLATVSPTGTANATTFLRGDNTWAAAGGATTVPFATRSTNVIINSQVFQDMVSVTLEANKTYFIEGAILAQRVGPTSGNGNMRLTYTGSGTTDFGVEMNNTMVPGTVFGPSSFDYELVTGTTNGMGVAVSKEFVFNGYIRTTTAGTLTAQFARGASNTAVDINVREGTYLLARPLN